MKKILLGLGILTFLTGCSNDDGSISGIGNEGRMIRLNAGVKTSTISTFSVTGPINSGFSTDFPIGIYAKDGAWLAGSSANLINNDQATVAGATGHAITFASGPYYYPDDGTVVNFYAFAPFTIESTAAGAGTSPIVTHTINGQQDVMWATSNGNKVGSAAAVNPVLNFQHKLTQLQFTFKSGIGYNPSGNKVVSLFIKSQPTTVAMTVETGVCTFSGSTDMQALSSANQTAGISITTAGTNANSPLMTNSSSSYLLDVVVKPSSGAENVAYIDIPVTLTSTIGSAHMITLTFNDTSISATATVADWVPGAGGSAVAQ